LLHSFYHKLCPTCAESNYNNRFIQPDLRDRNVIITGGRVKIGYSTALKMLKPGANVTVTTRFPALALEQFEKEADFELWGNRLWVYGLNLRNLNGVE
jgi:NAD(P)-dependent dehydrogenase (short-subunit alcohol dehydrogenase family)